MPDPAGHWGQGQQHGSWGPVQNENVETLIQTAGNKNVAKGTKIEFPFFVVSQLLGVSLTLLFYMVLSKEIFKMLL